MSVHHHQPHHLQVHTLHLHHQLKALPELRHQHHHTYIYTQVSELNVIHHQEYHHFHQEFAHWAHHTSKQYSWGCKIIDCSAHVYQKQQSIGVNELHVAEQVAVYHQSWVVTVIVTVPSHIAVTNQVLLTVAILVLLLLQVTLGLLASLGFTVAVNCSVSHTLTDILFLSNVTHVTCIWLTANVQLSLYQSSVTVIVTLPSHTGVTSQLLSTVAILVLLLVQTKFWFVALPGVIVAFNWNCLCIDAEWVSNDTHCTYTSHLNQCINHIILLQQ